MPHHIKGITAVKAVTLTRAGMNPEAKVVLLKSKAGRQTPTPANPTGVSDMDVKLLKSVAGFDQESLAYVGTLHDDKVAAFVALTPEARTAEIVKSRDAEVDPVKLLKGMVMMSDGEKSHVAHLPDDQVMNFMKMNPEDKAAAVKKSKDERDRAAQALASESPEIAAVRKSMDDRFGALDGKLDKLLGGMTPILADATETKFKSRAKAEFPNVPNAHTILKSIAGLSDDDQKPTLAMLKSQNDSTGRFAQAFGGFGDDQHAEGSAAARYDAEVKTVAKAKSIPEHEARVEMAGDPKWQELINEVREEELRVD